jgi:hypothetical protein
MPGATKKYNFASYQSRDYIREILYSVITAVIFTLVGLSDFHDTFSKLHQIIYSA